jgi:hypothetical protein
MTDLEIPGISPSGNAHLSSCHACDIQSALAALWGGVQYALRKADFVGLFHIRTLHALSRLKLHCCNVSRAFLSLYLIYLSINLL